MNNTKKKKGLLIAFLAVIGVLCAALGFSALFGAFGGGRGKNQINAFAATNPVQHDWLHRDLDAIDLNAYVAQNGTRLEGGSSEALAKHYYLSGDLTLTNITVGAEDGGDSFIDLCLNSHKLTAESGSVITVERGGKLTLHDCEGGGLITGGTGTLVNNAARGGGIYVAAGGGLDMYGGEIKESTAELGGAIYAAQGSNVTLGGTATVSASEATSGGAVYVSGSIFTLKENAKIAGSTAELGGGVYLDGGLISLEGGEVSGNHAQNGGAVYVQSGTLLVNGASIINNEAAKADEEGGLGGAIYVAGGTANIYGTVGGSGAEANTAYYGGGVAIEGGTLNIEDGGVISYNAATENGGGVYMTGGEVHVNEGGTVAFNSAQNGGGAYVSDGTLYILGGTISNNTANTGGGVYLSGGVLDMSAGTIADHTASTNGGGVYVADEGTFELSADGVIRNNTVTTSGGGVYMNGGEFTMDGGAISGNTATAVNQSGGGVYIANNAVFTMNDGFISDNQADGVSGDGGGVLVDGSTFNMTGGTVSGNTGLNSGGGVRMLSGVFNMTGGSIIGNSTAGNYGTGGGVEVYIDSTFNMYGGEISGNTVDRDGGGVKIDEGTFNMYGGTISGNTVQTNGGGVHVSSGTFNFYGGEIKNNTATGNGGGVYMAAGTFTMGGELPEDVELPEDFKLSTPTISGNTITVKDGYGGGVFVTIGATFNMYSGEISGNKSIGESGDGGGVAVVGGEFLMTGGEIFGNTNDTQNGGDGGGVIVAVSGSTAPKFTMTGGEIYGNTANAGGGVSLYGTTSVNAQFIMKAGEDGSVPVIYGNSANFGGGVRVTLSTFDMQGGKIYDNTAAYGGSTAVGGGVFVDLTSTFNLSGNVEIYGNTGNGATSNVRLRSSRVINVTGKLGDGEATKKIGVSMETVGTFTSGLPNNGDISYFFSDSAKYVVENDNGNAKLINNPDGHIHGEGEGALTFSAITAAGTLTTGNYYLNPTGTNTAITGQITVKAGQVVHLCLNGFTLQNTANVINVNGGTLYLYDCGSTGKVTNNMASSSAVYVGYGGRLILESGTVTNSGKNTVDGGGVCVDGANSKFTMNGGTISDNSTATSGGGVCVRNSATFEMNGGIIKSNTATSGAGVYVTGAGSKFTMNGGTIYNNTATTGGEGGAGGGGGVKVAGGTFNLIGGTITGNKAYVERTGNNGGDGSGIIISDSGTVNMYGGEISKNEAADAAGGVYVAATFNMYGGTISGNTAPYAGGVFVYGANTFTMGGTLPADAPVSEVTAPVISGNTATTWGGGVYMKATSGSFNMKSGKIEKNTVNGSNTETSWGGGVLVASGAFTMSAEAVISGNTAVNGGGVYVAGGTFTMEGGIIENNTAGEGGGVYFAGTTFNMSAGEISGNTANAEGTNGNGGGVYLNAGVFNMSGEAVISGNTAPYGGGVNMASGEFNLKGGSISENTATLGGGPAGGGGVRMAGGTLNMSGGEISGNTTLVFGADGGGIMLHSGTINMSDGEIKNNRTKDCGGGIYVYVGAQFTMSGGTISGNVANYAGGVIANRGTFTMTGGTISDNAAILNGGGITVKGSTGTATLTGGTISGNNGGGNAGGGVNVEEGTLKISGNLVVTGNTANGVENNIYLDKGNAMSVGALNADAKIGVTLASNYGTGAFTSSVSSVNCANKQLVSDDSTLCIWQTGSNLYIKAHQPTSAGTVVGKDAHNHYYQNGCSNSLDGEKFAEPHKWGAWGNVNPQSGEQWHECQVAGCGAQEKRVLAVSGIFATADAVYEAGDVLKNVKVKYIMLAADGGYAEFPLASGDYTIIYNSGNKLHWGDTSVTVKHVADDGKEYYATINDLVVGRTLESISATPNAGEPILFTTALTVDDLKAYITVVASYNDGPTAELSADEYTIKGTLGVGARTFTLTSLNGKTTTVTLTLVDDDETHEERDKWQGSLATKIAAAKKAIDDSRMTDEQKKAAKDFIEEQGAEWQAKLDEEADAENFDSYVQGFEDAVFDTLEEARIRTEKKELIDSMAEAKKSEIDGLELSDERKDSVKKRVDDLNAKALGDIDLESELENFDTIIAEYEEELNKLLQDENLAEKADFWNDLEEHAAAKKEYVDSREDLPEEEKERRKNAIDEELARGNEAIKNAESVEDAQAELDKAKLEISRIADENYDKKEEAKKKVDEEAQKKKDEIDGREDLTPEEKEEAKKKVDEEAQKAKDAIDKAITPEEIEQAFDNGLQAVEDAGTPSSPHEIGGLVVILAIEAVSVLALGAAGVIIKKKKGL